MENERIADIESKLAFQERVIQELNDVVYQQQQQIDKLEKLSLSLQSRVSMQSESPLGNLEDEKPPHY